MFEDNADLNLNVEIEIDNPAKSSKSIAIKRKSDPLPTTSDMRAEATGKIKKSNISGTPPKPNPKTKRKFPGPAGLITSSEFNDKSLNLTQLGLQTQPPTVELHENNQWLDMLRDFGDKSSQCPIKLLKTKAKLDQLPGKKAQFLAAYIQNIEYFGRNANVNVTLVDGTGSITGLIVSKLYAEYHKHLRIGSVIVMKEVGVLTFGRNHFVTITSKSLNVIYDKNKKIVVNGFIDVTDFNQSDDDIVRSAFQGIDTSDFFSDF